MDNEKKDRTPRQLGKAAVESRGREDPTHNIPNYTGKGRQWEEEWFLRDPQVCIGYPVSGLKSRVVEGGGGKVQLRPQLPKGLMHRCLGRAKPQQGLVGGVAGP